MQAHGKTLTLIAMLLLLTSLDSWADDQYVITVEPSVPVKMRDGVVLDADIYHPNSSDKFPVLLERTPYNKDSAVNFAIRAATYGYVVIVQDVRGRYPSEGEWYPFKHESQDGYDTIEWAAALPNSSGKVGMFGGSYVGATQMLAAIARPPHLAGICPVVTASNYHNGWTYQGGAFEQWFDESWTTQLAQDTVNRYLTTASDALEGSHALPLSRYPLFNLNTSFSGSDLTAKFAPYFLDWLAHPSFDDYWRQWSFEDHYADIQVPALTVAAWYDIFQGGSLRNYMRIKTQGGSEAARQSQQLLVIIGGHSGVGRKVGDVDFGPTAAFSTDDTTLNWYNFLFKGIKNDFAKPEPVKIFVMGANTWRDEEAWPLARATLEWPRELHQRQRYPFGSTRRQRAFRSICIFPGILFRPSAVRCAATPLAWRRDRVTSDRWNSATTYSSTLLLPWPQTRRLPARSAWNSMRNRQPWTQISRRNW